MTRDDAHADHIWQKLLLRLAWIPARAGMTFSEDGAAFTIVIPLKSGIHASFSWQNAGTSGGHRHPVRDAA